MKILLTLLAAILAAGVAGEVQAGLINLADNRPDIYSDGTWVHYDYGTTTLTATGYVERVTTLTTTASVNTTPFKLTATIDHSGVATGGTLEIDGTVASLGYVSGTLLKSNTLSQFGYMDPPTGGEVFEFVFSGLSGDLASSFGSAAGVILTGASTHFTGVFTSAAGFTNQYDGYSDTSPVPEPATLAFGLLGGGWILVKRRVRQARLRAAAKTA